MVTSTSLNLQALLKTAVTRSGLEARVASISGLTLSANALYVMFFPQLVAGPIERPGHLLPQLHVARRFDPERLVGGLKLMAWGLFKKVVIADRLAGVVNLVYGAPAQFHGPAVAPATIFFSFQIYCDFSGYSDIAIVERAQSSDDIRDWVGMSPVWIRWSAYYLVIAAILALGVFDRSRFIYFQF